MSILLQPSHRASFNVVRQQYFSAISLSDLFQNTTDQRILDFIKAIGFY